MRVLRSLALFVPLAVVAACDSGQADGPPVSARIVQVTVNDAPLFDPRTGDSWDDGTLGGGAPDVYFRLFDDAVDSDTDPGADRLNPRDDGDVVFARSSAEPWYTDVDDRDFPLVWDVEDVRVSNLSDPLYVALFDRDGGLAGGDDAMAESEVFRLRTFAPDRTDGRTVTFDLAGTDLDGSPTDFAVRVTVVYDAD